MIPEKKVESVVAGEKDQGTTARQAPKPTKFKAAEQGSTSMKAAGVVPKKRSGESEAAPAPLVRPAAPQVSTATTAAVVAFATPEQSNQPVKEIPFGPSDVPSMPVAGPSCNTATTTAGPSRPTATAEAGVSKTNMTSRRPTSIAETPIKAAKVTSASTSKRPLPAVDVQKHIAKRLKTQAIAERRQMRALEQAGITMGLDAETDMQRRKEKVAEEMEVAYNRGLQKGIGLTVPVSP